MIVGFPISRGIREEARELLAICVQSSGAENVQILDHERLVQTARHSPKSAIAEAVPGRRALFRRREARLPGRGDGVGLAQLCQVQRLQVLP
jgi:hypothetical protein